MPRAVCFPRSTAALAAAIASCVEVGAMPGTPATFVELSNSVASLIVISKPAEAAANSRQSTDSVAGMRIPLET
jgi:hypothetical protein